MLCFVLLGIALTFLASAAPEQTTRLFFWLGRFHHLPSTFTYYLVVAIFPVVYAVFEFLFVPAETPKTQGQA